MDHTSRPDPVLRFGAAIAVVGSLLLTLAACGGSSAGPAESSAGSSAGSSAEAPSTASAPAGSSTTAQQPTMCTDVAGDGGPADLTSVDITPAVDGVRVTWTTSQDVATIAAAAPSLLFNVTVIRADGNQVTDLGVRANAGTFDKPFVFDFSASKQTATSTEASLNGTTITATYPAEVITALGPSWTWSASTTYDTADVDRCPDANATGTGTDPEVTTGP